MFDENYFLNLSEGKERIKYLKKCIDDADKEKDYKASIELRYLHIKESTFNEDNLDSLIVFPEYMALYDKHPDLHDRYTFMYAFKWIIESIMNFPQVSIEMAESYFEEFKRRCEMYGYTLKIYYMKQINFFEKIDPEKTMKLLELFRGEERDQISDEIGDDMSLEICTELDYGSEEKAMKLLGEMRKNGIRSGEVPQITYGKCVEYFTRKGNFTEAEYYADLLTPMTRGTGTYYMMEMSNVMILKTFTDTKAALAIFRRYIEHFLTSKNVKFRFYFANASYRLFKKLKNDGHDVISLKIPRIFELYNDSGEYDTEKLSCYFRKLAEEGAEKFDKRNRNTMYSAMLDFEYPDAPVIRSDLPGHGTAEKRPAALAVPFVSSDSIPAHNEIIEAVGKLPDTVVTSHYFDEERTLLSVRAYNKKADTEIEFHFIITPIIDGGLNPWQFSSRHYIPAEELEEASEEFSVSLGISVMYNKNAESFEYNQMLKLADMLNTDNSPVIIDYNTFKILSGKWVGIQAQTDIPPYEFYMYNVFVDPAKIDGKFNITTAGLRKFGSKDIFIPNVDEEKVDFAYRIVSAAARCVCSYQPLPDEGEKAFLNAFFNNDTAVYYSWKKGSRIKNDFGEDSADFAVPEIYLCYDGEACAVNDITEDTANRIVFRAPNRYYSIDNALSRERFEYARKAFESGEYDSLEVGFEAELAEKCGEIYAKMENAEDLSAIIIDGIDGLSGLDQGDRITINPEKVYFWKLEKNGRNYFADSTYLII